MRANVVLTIRDLVVELPSFTMSVDKLDIRAGTIVHLDGANGSGKSTFLKTIAGLGYRYTGHIGEHGLGASGALRKCYAHSSARFIEAFSVLDVFRLCAWASANWDAALAAQLQRTLDLDTAKDVGTLSSGNRAKLSLVVALAQAPELLLLDEPFAFLDEQASAALAAVLRDQIACGRTVLVATHDCRSILPHVDQVVCFDRGRGSSRGVPTSARASERVAAYTEQEGTG